MATPIKAQKLPPRTDLAFDRLRELLVYEPETGLFRWRISRTGCRAGTIAGSLTPPQGYVRVIIDHKRYWAHRLAWFYMTGQWPKSEIDHINGKPSENMWSNIREATRSQNRVNTRRPCKGASWNSKEGKWIAYICRQGRRFFIGSFKTAEAAHAAYLAASLEVDGEFVRLE